MDRLLYAGRVSDPILDDLNRDQRAAVMHGGGPLLVLAGAGSGKTRVVTRRIARLLRDGVPPGSILAMTFTNKAAGEMARRVQELGGAYVRVATFHSACARFLRSEAERIGFPRDYSIYDTYDRDSLLKQLMEETGLDRYRVKPSQVGSLISRMKNSALKPEDLDAVDGSVASVARQLFAAYGERLRKLGAMDFDDLLLHFLALLTEHPDAAEAYRARFPHVLVDEFQDTNRVQYDLLRRMTTPDGDVCVVGDPDQSIYGFRGAEIRNILDFENDYPGTVTVRLQQNYRSTRNILRAAEAVIERNKLRKPKRLVTENEDGVPLSRFRARGPAEEADAIARRVIELSAGGTALDQIAVFYRAHWLSRALEEAMKEHGIPYRIVGGLTFFERREIKDLLAYLRILVNPLDDVSMERVINVPPRGIGKASIGRLREIASANSMSLREVVTEPALHAGLSRKAGKSLRDLAGVVERARVAAASGVRSALAEILQGTGYLEYATGLGDPEDVTREENIAELLSDAVQFDEKQGTGLSGYLQHVSLLTSADRDGEGPAVQMMTVHAAKGLEFDHVFIAGLEEGLFPSARALEARDGLEEERRLVYVALTRARKSVFLSHARERMVGGFQQRMMASCFLREIPSELLRNAEAGGCDEADGDWTVCDETPADEDLGIGSRVRHPQFGTGTVRSLTGRGDLARTVVRFDDGVDRTLILRHAGLTVLDWENGW
ncbi:MAG: UvrD-helicase domain-containing protein [Planctomycetota bacterium]